MREHLRVPTQKENLFTLHNGLPASLVGFGKHNFVIWFQHFNFSKKSNFVIENHNWHDVTSENTIYECYLRGNIRELKKHNEIEHFRIFSKIFKKVTFPPNVGL